MKRFLLLGVLSICSIQLLSQHNLTISGQVLYISSQKKPAVELAIYVAANDRNQKWQGLTGINGEFQIIVTASEGDFLTLHIGDQDDSGHRLTLINQKDVSQIRVGKVSMSRLQLLVCRQGEITARAKNFQSSISSYLQSTLSQKKSLLEQALLRPVREREYTQISLLSSQIAQLEKESDTALIYMEALNYALINKDQASPPVLKHLNWLEAGQHLDRVRTKLGLSSQIKLLRIGSQIQTGVSLLEQAIQELELRASGSQVIGDYQDAIACYDTILAYCHKAELADTSILPHYLKAADLFFLEGQYQETLDLQKKALNIQETHLSQDDTRLHDLYSKIGDTYLALDQQEEANLYFQKIIKKK